MMKSKYKIVVVGLGYVGLSNAALLAQHNEVVGVDLSQKRIDDVNLGKSPIVDDELSQYLLEKNLKLSATRELSEALVNADYVIVSTPTNYNEKTNFFDTSLVENVVSEVVMKKSDAFIIIKSTIPIGFVEKLRNIHNTKLIAFSPEFLREGKALYDNLHPSRIIIGDQSQHAKTFASLLANGALKKNVEILLTDPGEAEAIKLFANSYLAMRVAFFNELDTFTIGNQLNSQDIIRGVCLDPRIGSYYNNPSFGYGGYCLPKDTKQLLSNFETLPQNIIQAIITSNETRKDFIADEIAKQQPKIVGIYSLAMKSGSDNTRQSSIIGVIERLTALEIQTLIYHPSEDHDKNIDYPISENLNDFIERSDLIIANRMHSDLEDVQHKVFTRDLFGAD